AAGTPVIASRIPGSVGLLGDDYPGYFHAGDACGLAAQLRAAETNRSGFYDERRLRRAALRPLVDPAREREAWASCWPNCMYHSSSERTHMGRVTRGTAAFAAFLSFALAACGRAPGDNRVPAAGDRTLSISAIPDQDPQLLQRQFDGI